MPNPTSDATGDTATTADVSPSKPTGDSGKLPPGEPVCDALEGFRAGFLFAVNESDCDGPGTEKNLWTCGDSDAPVASFLGKSGAKVSLSETLAAFKGEAAPPLVGELGNYCLYLRADERRVGRIGPAPLDPVRARPLVVPLGSLGEEVWRAYAVAQTQTFAGSTSQVDGTTKVRLVLIDTFRTEEPETLPTGPSAHSHGLSLALSGQDLACGDKECTVQVATRMGLPLVEPEIWKIQEAGDYGPLEWLAQSIVREVLRWEREKPFAKLILNLSVGWHPQVPEAPDTAAVQEALRYARCRGAVVIAAVGNRMGGDEPESGMFYPAAYSAQSVGSCSEYGDNLVGMAPGPEEPLLFAVDAVGADGTPIAISRDGIATIYQGYGHQVLTVKSQAARQLPMTGTSAAAVAVAARAASLWSVDGELTIPELMAQVAKPPAILPEALMVRPITPDDLIPVRSKGQMLLNSGISDSSPWITLDQPLAWPTPVAVPCPPCGLDTGPSGEPEGSKVFIDIPPQFYAQELQDIALHVRRPERGSGDPIWTQFALAETQAPGPAFYQLPENLAGAERALVFFTGVEGNRYVAEIGISPTPGL